MEIFYFRIAKVNRKKNIPNSTRFRFDCWNFFVGRLEQTRMDEKYQFLFSFEVDFVEFSLDRLVYRNGYWPKYFRSYL